MTEVVLFGGTEEGRVLCLLLGQKGINTLVCVATEYGAGLLPSLDTVRVHTGRLDREGMKRLLETEKPRLVIDATHPFAAEARENIKIACEKAGIKRLGLSRESLDSSDCVTFSRMERLISWVNERPGTIFSALGAKEAPLLTRIDGYKERVWLRILPDVTGLSACLAAGFPPWHIICMQGPFSRELNAAMFRAAGADILLTKESGQAGGYLEKLEAARECGMVTAVLSRPCREDGVTLAALAKLIEEDAL